MIFGIGIDMIEVERVEHKLTKDSGFREFVFSENEIEYCESKTHKYEHYAACFAAKEAFLKALGTGWSNGIAFNEIESKYIEQRGVCKVAVGFVKNIALIFDQVEGHSRRV